MVNKVSEIVKWTSAIAAFCVAAVVVGVATSTSFVSYHEVQSIARTESQNVMKHEAPWNQDRGYVYAKIQDLEGRCNNRKAEFTELERKFRELEEQLTLMRIQVRAVDGEEH